MIPALRTTWLGRVEYLDAWRMQEAVATRVRAGDAEHLLLLEHPPVYTIGRRGTTEHLLVGPDVLRQAGASVYRVDRGGDITYHGPGQLVGYPITRLGENDDLVAYVRAIELAIGDALASYGVAGRSATGKTGVWVDLPGGGPAKIAAIGVRVSRGVTTHGFALNVSTDLAGFGRIMPCGFVHEVASLERLGVRTDIRDVAERCAVAFAARIGRARVPAVSIPSPREEEIPLDAPVRTAVDLLAEAIPA